MGNLDAIPYGWPTRYCSTESCDRRHHAKGLCKTRNARLLKRGDPEHCEQRHGTAAEESDRLGAAKRAIRTTRYGREGCEPARPIRDIGAIPLAGAAQVPPDQGGVGLRIE